MGDRREAERKSQSCLANSCLDKELGIMGAVTVEIIVEMVQLSWKEKSKEKLNKLVVC